MNGRRLGSPAAAALIALLALASCSSASTAVVPAVAGTYSAYVIDGANGCGIAGVLEGASGSGVPITVTQDSNTPQNVTVTLHGAPGQLLAELTGSASLAGTLGSQAGVGSLALTTPSLIDASAPMPTSVSGCLYTVSATLEVTFTSDTLQGTLVYAFATNGATSCGKLSTCQTVQAFAGVLVPPATDASAESG